MERLSSPVAISLQAVRFNSLFGQLGNGIVFGISATEKSALRTVPLGALCRCFMELKLPRPISPRKKWIFRILTVASACGLAVLFFQVLIHDRLRDLRIQLTDEPIYLQEPGHERTGHRYLYDENLGWRNIPGWSATTNGRKLTINSKGLRDREHAYEKPKNTQRILVLGDSYA